MKKIKCSIYANGYDEIGWNSPDYANAQLLFNPQRLTNQPFNYTVLDDGWIGGSITLINSGVTSVKVNDIVVSQAYGMTNVISGRDGLFAKVSKSDTVVVSTNGNYDNDLFLYFIPHK